MVTRKNKTTRRTISETAEQRTTDICIGGQVCIYLVLAYCIASDTHPRVR